MFLAIREIVIILAKVRHVTLAQREIVATDKTATLAPRNHAVAPVLATYVQIIVVRIAEHRHAKILVREPVSRNQHVILAIIVKQFVNLDAKEMMHLAAVPNARKTTALGLQVNA